jgi:tetratricopeptide (TPR) repeat protein
MTAFRAQAELGGELAERFFRRIGDDAVPLADAMDDLDGAIKALDHAFDLAPRNEREEIAGELGYLRLARFELGSQERDDLDTAIWLLRQAVEADPDLATAAELGRALDAGTASGQMRTIDPDALDAWAACTYQGR